ncbi:MAG TPA: tRNA (N(6)-L-threonylcarbamoyladenosine(37)-C(2))-methylthiotransferase MtaB, partial [Clostridiaceae bacterium]|nr:tRNA (N(6)-L-threonylcarbamoyladenosine(37)-C(2))-methylthiotransferase MtaB [Clostridiaceae bacterium]
YSCGCKVNQYETNAMAEQFIDNNYEIVNFEEFADVYIINTCTVTNMSDRKSRQIIRRAKQINSNSILVATGCYAQTAKEELEKITDIDLIVGNTEKKDIVKIVEEYRDNKNRERVKMSDINKQKEFVDFGSVTYTEKTRAVIKVQDGCNNFCSYCIIPYAKGRVRSRKLESVVKEITEIAEKGIKEVVITGIHVASYGIDFDNNTRLIDLLEAIQKIDGIKRIRLGSLEPNIITEEFVNRLKKVTKMCDHFHLSLQSGCDETLKRMNRKYTAETFEKEVNLLRKTFPDVALTTDVIVGFPGETEEEFNETYKYLSKIRFTKLHVFKYSPRKGTVAAKMKNQIDSTVKEKRSHKLIELSNECEIEFLDRYVGKELKVLFEKQDGEYIKGHTTNYLVVKAKETELENQIKDVKIVSRDNLELIGEM